jgi:hypothetical protein
MFSPYLDWVNNFYFSMPGTGRFHSMLPPFMPPGIFASSWAFSFLILHLDAVLHSHAAAFADISSMVKDFM